MTTELVAHIKRLEREMEAMRIAAKNASPFRAVILNKVVAELQAGRDRWVGYTEHLAPEKRRASWWPWRRRA